MSETRDNLFAPNEESSRIQAAVNQRTCQACIAATAAGAAFCPQCGGNLQKNASGASASEKASSAEAPADSDPTPPTPLQELIKAAAKSQPQIREVASEKADETFAPVKCNCGKILPEDARYCSKCGVQVGQKTPRYGLRHVSNGNGGQVVEITDEDLTIGKSNDCGLVIANDEYVSRRHARIFQANEMLFLEDLNSSNGTFLRPRRPIILEAGDEILIGTSLFRLEEAT